MREEKQDQAKGQNGAPVSRETSARRETGTPQKNRRSAVYLYLLILFGAAFLMLLLAYFVQRRNNESTITGLQNSWNLSREQLVEDNQRLEEENQTLQGAKAELEAQLVQLQRQKDELETDSFWREKDLLSQLASWNDLWGLEQNFRDKDYEACAQFFRNVSTSNYYGTPPDAAERVEEIYWALVEQGVLNEEDFPLSTIFLSTILSGNK